MVCKRRVSKFILLWFLRTVIRILFIGDQSFNSGLPFSKIVLNFSIFGGIEKEIIFYLLLVVCFDKFTLGILIFLSKISIWFFFKSLRYLLFFKFFFCQFCLLLSQFLFVMFGELGVPIIEKIKTKTLFGEWIFNYGHVRDKLKLIFPSRFRVLKMLLPSLKPQFNLNIHMMLPLDPLSVASIVKKSNDCQLDLPLYLKSDQQYVCGKY